jgi:hypothetical protein
MALFEIERGARFEIERGVPSDHPKSWVHAGEVKAIGDRAEIDAIDAIADRTGWYRTRIVGERDDQWRYCQVALPQSGEKQIRCSDDVSF